MKLGDLPQSVKVRACSHVLEKQRPVRVIGFENGVFLTCNEPDHGLFGDEYAAYPTLKDVFQIFPWLKKLGLEAGQRMELQENDVWKTVEITRGPREVTVAERDAYYAERKKDDN